MSQFLETIQLRDGEFKLLELHQKRMDLAISENYPNVESIPLSEYLHQSNYPTKGLYKCRLLFSSNIEKLEFVPYEQPIIKTLKVIETNLPTWLYKLSDRSSIQELVDQKGEFDDVLILRDGLLTDTSYCNIALLKGNQWFTPRLALLYGVQRAHLLQEKQIIEKDILVTELSHYSKICLFNAMNEFGALQLSISDIVI